MKEEEEEVLGEKGGKKKKKKEKGNRFFGASFPALSKRVFFCFSALFRTREQIRTCSSVTNTQNEKK